MRETAYNLDKLRTEDGVWRAAGAMKYARAMSTEEAMDHLSSLRTGVSLGIVKLDAAALNSLLWEIQPANLTEVSGKGRLTPSERDAARAELLRRKITL